MSLPDGFLDELRTRLSLAQVVGRKVMWDTRKSNQGKGDMWAPCPFHQEKTASFHVDDRKGYYYCFGCHAKGDAIKFVRETENVGFMEAVEILAGEAGMQMPARDPKAQAKADKRTQLAEVMEQAVQFFRLQLKTAAGAGARDYLDGRGLSEDVLARWEIGFAPDGWQGLWDHLAGKGVAPALIVGAGLAKESQKGGKPYDVFRNRIMFPIRDARGRCIAFGGRAMDPSDAAKYLNSPETELFDKGRNLYNHGPAREAAGKGAPLIVAEGYMDVIALVEAGFGGAVAPLGTAVTEHQLAMMWRIADEPIIALDGDKAGLRAAMRLIDLALPLLEAGKSLRFVLMPEGQDPDDLLRAAGPAAVRRVLEAAQPMVRLLWQRETEGKSFDSPERKAALDKALRERIKLIKDPSIRQHYGQEIKDLRFQLFRPARSGPARRDWRAPPPAQASTRASALASGPAEVTTSLREAVILAVILRFPALLDDFAPRLERLPCPRAEAGALRDAMIRFADDQVSADAGALRAHLEQEIGPAALDGFLRQSHLSVVPSLRGAPDLDLARMTVAEELAKIGAELGLAAEIAEAEEDLAASNEEALTWRLKQATEAMARAGRGTEEDSAEYDLGPNGAPINREERSALDSLLDQIGFGKDQR